MVVDEIKAWQARPLDEVSAILYIDKELRLWIKDDGSSPPQWPLWPSSRLKEPERALGFLIQDDEGAAEFSTKGR